MKRVCFIGRRKLWQNMGMEKALEKTIINLIKEGYDEFFVGEDGYFERLAKIKLLELRKKYSIKIVRVLTYYKEKEELEEYDEIIYPPLESVYYKRKIIKKNQWMIDNSEVLVCNAPSVQTSGAYMALKYAIMKGKEVVELSQYNEEE